MSIEKKINNICEYLSGFDSVALAYSGGVDSTLLLHLLKRSGIEKLLAVTVESESYRERDSKTARMHTGRLGVEHLFIRTSELENPGFSENSFRRCYHCKIELFSAVRETASAMGIRSIFDASHAGDTEDYRPGLEAAGEIGVESPFINLDWDKACIREVSAAMGIEGVDRPSTVCLASRVSYGTHIDAEILKEVELAEDYLEEKGFFPVRVRTDGVTARIELEPGRIQELTAEMLRNDIVGKFMEIGFSYVSLDLEGFRSGKMNRMLPDNER